MMQRQKEEEAIVLDFLLHGYMDDKSPAHMKTPIGQSIGTNGFTLLELVPKKGIFLQPLERVYIGEAKREKIHHINGKLKYERLSSTAKAELEHAIAEIVKLNEKDFVEFFNKAQPLSTRMHIFELLPGVGKKHMMELVEERREADFNSFEDIKKRVKLMPDPEKVLVKRIIKELKGEEKHNLFTSY